MEQHESKALKIAAYPSLMFTYRLLRPDEIVIGDLVQYEVKCTDNGEVTSDSSLSTAIALMKHRMNWLNNLI